MEDKMDAIKKLFNINKCRKIMCCKRNSQINSQKKQIIIYLLLD